MVVLACPFPACDHATGDLEMQAALVMLTIHGHSHAPGGPPQVHLTPGPVPAPHAHKIKVDAPKVNTRTSADSTSVIIIDDDDAYCLICQEAGHQTSPRCIACKVCHKTGHARKDCSQIETKTLNEIDVPSASKEGQVKIVDIGDDDGDKDTYHDLCEGPSRTENDSVLGIVDQDVPSEYKCTICKELMVDAAFLPCCSVNLCQSCIPRALKDDIESNIEGQSTQCTLCETSGLLIQDIVPNLRTRRIIMQFKQKKDEQKIMKETASTKNYDVPSKLKCTVCKTMMVGAVILPCCGFGICLPCLPVALKYDEQMCMLCQTNGVMFQDVMPDFRTRRLITEFIQRKEEFAKIKENPSNCTEINSPDSLKRKATDEMAISDECNKVAKLRKEVTSASHVTSCLLTMPVKECTINLKNFNVPIRECGVSIESYKTDLIESPILDIPSSEQVVIDILSDSGSDIENEDIEINTQTRNLSSSPSIACSTTIEKLEEYTIIALQVETIHENNKDEKDLTQIGCTALEYFTGSQSTFLKVVQPPHIERYLAMKMKGDLLKCLNIQQNDVGEFEFRKPFEIIQNANDVIKCTTEENALESLSEFLVQFKNPILMCLDDTTVKLIMKKLEESNHKEAVYSCIKGFCSWKDFLGGTNNFYEETSMEFEEFIEKTDMDIPDNLNAWDISTLLIHAVEWIKRISHIQNLNIFLQQICTPLDMICAQIQHSNTVDNLESPLEFLEISKNWKLSAQIQVDHVDTLDLSSDSDDDLPIDLPGMKLSVGEGTSIQTQICYVLNSNYFCSFCNIMLHSEEFQISHACKSPKNQVLRCNSCGRTFKNPYWFDKHFKISNCVSSQNYQQYQPTIFHERLLCACGRTFTDQNILNMHLKTSSRHKIDTSHKETIALKPDREMIKAGQKEIPECLALKPEINRLKIRLGVLKENKPEQLENILRFVGNGRRDRLTMKQWSGMIVQTIREQFLKFQLSPSTLLQFLYLIDMICKKYRAVYEPLFEKHIGNDFYLAFIGQTVENREKMQKLRDTWSKKNVNESDCVLLHDQYRPLVKSGGLCLFSDNTRAILDARIVIIDSTWRSEKDIYEEHD